MSATNHAWLFVILGVLAFVLNIAAVAFLFTKWSKYPRPTSYAIGGFGLILLAQIGTKLFAMVLGSMVNLDAFVFYNAVASCAGSMLHFAGLCLLIVAVYVDRRYNSALPAGAAVAAGTDPDRRGSARTADSNPYAV